MQLTFVDHLYASLLPFDFFDPTAATKPLDRMLAALCHDASPYPSQPHGSVEIRQRKKRP
jgi:hypothetical protein